VPDEPKKGDPVPDDAVVVRGGHMHVHDLIVSASNCFDNRGYHAWSFWGSRAGATGDAIARDAPFGNPHYRESTGARLRAEGFDPRFDRADDHVQVRLDAAPDASTCERLRRAFDPVRERT
jgi:hypothetical protein